MTASKSVTAPSWTDPDDAPELTDAQLVEAEVYEGDKFIRRGGRPKGSGTKELVSLRLDRAILDHFREGGPGWQTRLNDALRLTLNRKRQRQRADADTTQRTAAKGADAR